MSDHPRDPVPSLRRQFVPMPEILDALDGGEGAPRFFLHTATGELSLVIDAGADEPLTGSPDEVEVPRLDADEAHELRASFLLSLPEADLELRDELARALRGREGRARFAALLARHPDARAAWLTHRRSALLARACAWLGEIGLDPSFDLPPIPAPRPLGQTDVDPGQARVGLFDLLLLGLPEGPPPLRGGRVRRRVRAAGPEEARRIFERLARELSLHHGIPWKPLALDGSGRFELGPCVLELHGREVELGVAVGAAMREVFGAVSDPDEA